MLKTKENAADMSVSEEMTANRKIALSPEFCCDAKKWREFGDARTDSVRLLLDLCLSFVTPEQQGVSVAGRGDQN
jgi:hypothetical protein